MSPLPRPLIKLFRTACGAAILFAAAFVQLAHAEEPTETYDVVTVGNVTYTNVIVQTKTKTDLFIKHASGFANIKVKDLDRSTQLRLGYMVQETPTNVSPRIIKAPKIQIDPRFEELEEQIVWEAKEALAKVPPKIQYIAFGTLALIYLIFCNCCRLICQKTVNVPVAVGLVWLPVFKQIPLLRAAGMSGWWFVFSVLPPLFPLIYLVWSFKIAKARGKSCAVGWLLLLPIVQVFAFLYLALSRGVNEAEDDDRSRRGFITLYDSDRRNVA